MTKPLTLNIPKSKDQFEVVPFVKDMNQHQLKVFIKRMWLNVQEMANIMDDRRQDLSIALDCLLEGVKWDEKNFIERYQFFIHKLEVIEYDTKNNTFRVFDPTKGTATDPTEGMNYTKLKQTLKTYWTSPRKG